MRLLLSWVRDFVDITAPADEIAETMALRGFEVAAVEPVGDGDAVIDFEVTANRPDCLSVVGFAREIGTAFSLPVRLPSTETGAKAPLASVPTGASDRLKVTLEDAELCPRYAAGVAEVTAAVSPAWMTSRLQAAGVRPISPIVDITNYVLMELGHPMHAFDLATLAGSELRIRRAQRNEMLTTLDGVARKLDPEMLVIADARKAQAVAGVMGGGTSEVSGATRTVAFESAYFKPSSVRQTSKRLNLKTEASARFERGADVNAPVLALQRAFALMQQIGAGRAVGPIVDRYPSPRDAKTIQLRRTRLHQLLGLDIPDGEVVRILRSLGLIVGQTADGWTALVPTFRVDLTREADLI
jgi:phenylalanyl-tRNA synthetase beta chain